MFWEIFVLLVVLSAVVGALGMPWGVIAAAWLCIAALVVVGVIMGIGVQISYIWFPIAVPVAVG